MSKVYGVKFGDGEKKYFYASEEQYKVDELGIVETERGEQLVKIVEIIDKDIEIDGRIIRKSTDLEYQNYLNNLKEASKALIKAREFASELKLEMNIINASFNLDKSQLLFNFTAENRVDFRELAKRLASLYHTRIELRQIGARDKAKNVGGVGICGGELCCTRFLRSINTISMNMAKNQNLALNPSKINGSCGRLLCCLAYEDETYLDCMKGLPDVGDKIKTPKGEAQVISIDILNRKGKILIDGEKEDYDFKESKK